MKTVNVLLADISVMQPMLDETFGINVFVIDRIYNEELQWKEYFLTYDDSVPQATVDQAVNFVNDYHISILNNKKLIWYTKLQNLVNEKINSLSVYKFSSNDIAEAQQWLNDPARPIPGCVMFLAIKNNITNMQAADYIINSEINYQNLLNQLNAILVSSQNNLMTADMSSIRQITSSAVQQINNFPN